MSKATWEQLCKYEEIEAIIATQMHIYFDEGKGMKAMKLLRKIRRRMVALCKT